MKVYVVEKGSYDDRQVMGAYATLEAAMEAHPVIITDAMKVEHQRLLEEHLIDQYDKLGWHTPYPPDSSWVNGPAAMLDLDDRKTITEFSVEGSS